MKGLTEKQPKCRAVLHGKQLIEWQLEALERSGIVDISVVRGYLADNFQYPLKYFENSRWAETNMVVSLMAACEWLEGDTCIVSYSDIVYRPECIRILANSDADIAVAYDPNWERLWGMRFEDPLSDAETFRLDGDNVIEIGGKTMRIEDIQGQYLGLLRFTPKGWGTVSKYICEQPPEVNDQLDMTGLLRALIDQGVTITGVPIESNWYEVDH